MGSSAAVDKTEEELRKEIEELHRQQWEVRLLLSLTFLFSLIDNSFYSCVYLNICVLFVDYGEA